MTKIQKALDHLRSIAKAMDETSGTSMDVGANNEVRFNEDAKKITMNDDKFGQPVRQHLVNKLHSSMKAAGVHTDEASPNLVASHAHKMGLSMKSHEVVHASDTYQHVPKVTKSEIEEFKKAIDRVQALLEKVESLGDAGKALVANHIVEKAERLQLSEYDFSVKQLRKTMKNWHPAKTQKAEKKVKKQDNVASPPPPPPPSQVSSTGVAGAVGTSSAGISTGQGITGASISPQARAAFSSAFN